MVKMRADAKVHARHVVKVVKVVKVKMVIFIFGFGHLAHYI